MKEETEKRILIILWDVALVVGILIMALVGYITFKKIGVL